jgi:uncharacterized cupin superfamily protein
MNRVHTEQLALDPQVIRRPELISAAKGYSIWWMGDDRITFQATSEQTDGHYSFWIDEPPAACGPPKHVHSREEEGFYVLSGEATFQAGHVRSALGPNTFIALPAGIPHTWTNTSSDTARLITFTAPGGNEGFFLALGEPGAGEPGARKTMPVEEINQLTPRFGVHYMETTANPMDGALVLGAGRSATVVMPEEGDCRYSAGCIYNIKAAGPVTNNAYTLTEIHLHCNGVIPSHRHGAHEEAVYVLAGSLDVTVDGERFSLSVGDFLTIPWGLNHEMTNTSPDVARVLNLSFPGGIEDYYRAACRVAAQGDKIDMAADLERMRVIGPRFGVFS